MEKLMYNKDINVNITQNFTTDELRCPCCYNIGIDQEFMNHLQCARSIAGFPWKVNSGYRCMTYNKKVSPKSQNDHTRGQAVDIAVRSRYKRYKILKSILEDPYFKDIAIGKTFIHIGKGKKDRGIGIYP